MVLSEDTVVQKSEDRGGKGACTLIHQVRNIWRITQGPWRSVHAPICIGFMRLTGIATGSDAGWSGNRPTRIE